MYSTSPAAGRTQSQALAAFALHVEASQFPDAVRNSARDHFLDSLGVALASSTFEFGDAVLAAARELGSGDDARAIDGMVRFPEASKDMPWHADRPAITFYDRLAGDGRLDNRLQADAKAASQAVRDLVISHRESDNFQPFHSADYSDAVGPTVHLPTSRAQIDPWASDGVCETDNDFYKNTDEAAMTRVLA